jgi:hypothetical protein
MVETIKDAVAEKIEIVDQPEEITEQRGLTLWLALAAMLVLVVASFVVVRRLKRKEEE